MSTFRPNPAFESEAEAEIRPAKVAKAREAASAARKLVPRGDDARRGHVAERIREREVGGEVQMAIDHESFGHLVEFGGPNNFPFAPLRRGARAVGLRLDESPKP
jgi:hypothetical protein